MFGLVHRGGTKAVMHIIKAYNEIMYNLHELHVLLTYKKNFSNNIKKKFIFIRNTLNCVVLKPRVAIADIN